MTILSSHLAQHIKSQGGPYLLKVRTMQEVLAILQASQEVRPDHPFLRKEASFRVIEKYLEKYTQYHGRSM